MIPREKASELYRTAKNRAAWRKVPFELTKEQFEELIIAAGGKCAVSGIPFDFDPPRNGFRRPFAPSLDRINSDLGYTKDNCRLVCVAVNYAMADWGDGVFLRIAASACVMAGRDTWEKLTTQDGPVGLRGVEAALIRGRWRYRARIVRGGAEYIIGDFDDERTAHSRYLEVRATIAQGVPLSDFVAQKPKNIHTDASRSKRQTFSTDAQLDDSLVGPAGLEPATNGL